jgi:pimeloyl-ACP methyl ester carboxylesterase
VNHALTCLTWRALLLGLFVGGAVGCARYDMSAKYSSPQRAGRGMVVILPGIEGEGPANWDIRDGLYEAGVPYALVIYRWGTMVPGPGGMLLNQTDAPGNRRAARELALQIAGYQASNRGKPVFLIGHSAGGGIAIFTLEELGKLDGVEPIEGAVLLSASLSANYPLDGALRMVRRGIVNVHNPADPVLMAGSGLLGNVDGGHGASAGRTGFSRAYGKVFERLISEQDVWRETGYAVFPHFLATQTAMIRKYASPWLLSRTWPPPNADVERWAWAGP